MNIKINFISTESDYIDPSLKLKDYLKDFNPSLKNQAIDSDFFLKFNNNELSKILINNQIKDLVNKFHGNKILISPTQESVEEVENLFSSSQEKLSKLESINKTIETTRKNKLENLNFDLIEKKLISMQKKINLDDPMIQKGVNKIVKILSTIDRMYKDKNDVVHQSLIQLKITETFKVYNKILN